MILYLVQYIHVRDGQPWMWAEPFPSVEEAFKRFEELEHGYLRVSGGMAQVMEMALGRQARLLKRTGWEPWDRSIEFGDLQLFRQPNRSQAP